MAFEKIYEFVDRMTERYKRTEEPIYLEVLSSYFETVLQTAKFKDQREYCREKLFEICKPYAEGYFKTKKARK